jgi:intron-binding protein aquarius
MLTHTPDIILSLVRTKAIGYLRDIRRLTVALSRARLGLYVLGRRSVFESVFELKPAFDVLFTRPDELALVTGEMFGATARGVPADDAEVNAKVEGEATMTGYEHLEEYVRGITAAKIEALKMKGAALPTREVRMLDQGDDDLDREDMVLVPEEDAVGDFAEQDGDDTV